MMLSCCLILIDIVITSVNYLSNIILGLISFITFSSNTFSGELVCISRRVLDGRICWFLYDNASHREIKSEELCQYFSRGILFTYKKTFE